MVSEKYIAGLIDSDGYIGFKSLKQNYRPQLQIVIAQKKEFSGVLEELHKQLGGSLKDVKNKVGGDQVYTYWTLYSTKAKNLLSRIHKYLVIKKAHCKWLLDNCTEKVTDLPDFRQQMKMARKLQSLPLPNYPTRKWLAGYFDGDGCVYTSTEVRKNGNVGVGVHIVAHKMDIEGLEIIHKNFGGNIVQHSNKNCLRWQLLERNQVKKFLEYFGKHSYIKHDQIYSVFKYLDSKQNGSELKADLKRLKNPQRLNEGALLNE